MSDHELTPALRALLDVERAAGGPSAAAKERVLERLEDTLGLSGSPGSSGGDGGGGSAGGSGMSGASASSTGLSVSGLFGGKLALGGGLAFAFLGLVVGVGFGVLQGERELTPGERIEAALDPLPVASPPSLPSPPSPTEVAAPADDAADGFVIDEEAVRVRSEPQRRRRAQQRPRASTLADEQLLLDEARTALSRGDAEAAHTTLRKHAEAFPRGQLAEERAALLVLALARAGRADEAARAAASFRARWPDSLHRATVEAALAER